MRTDGAIAYNDVGAASSQCVQRYSFLNIFRFNALMAPSLGTRIADRNGSPDGGDRDAVLHQSEHTRVFRRRPADGADSIICKEPLGANAPERLRHEKKIIARLAGVEGVSRLAAGPGPATAIAL